jgi:hypothetical protein
MLPVPIRPIAQQMEDDGSIQASTMKDAEIELLKRCDAVAVTDSWTQNDTLKKYVGIAIADKKDVFTKAELDVIIIERRKEIMEYDP